MPQGDQDQFQFQVVYKKVKLKVFEAAKSYLDKCQGINPLAIYFLLLVQCLQILWFSIHPLLKFQNSPLLLNYARSALSFLNFEQSLRANNGLLVPFVIVTTSITVLHIITLVISIKVLSNKEKQKSEFANFIHTFATFQIILLNTVLTIPIFNVSAITLYCQEGSPYHETTQCYDLVHIIMCVFASFNLLVLILESLLYWFIFYLRNPFSKSYYALSNNLNKLGKLLIKILPPLYFVVDVGGDFQNIYVFLFLFLTIAYIAFFRIMSIHNFHQNFFYFELFMESVVAWFAINAAICYQFKSSGMNFIETIVCSLLCAYAICAVESALTKRFVICNIEGNIKKQDRQKFMYILINILFNEQAIQEMNPIVYIKMLNSSLNVCSLKISKNLMKNDLKTQQMQQLSRQMLLLLLQSFLQEASTMSLKLIKCNILYDSGLKILALHQVSQLRNDKLSIYEEFLIYYFKSTHKIYQTSNAKGVQQNVSEIQTYLHYIQHMNQFENQLQICAINNEQYWQQLCQDMPSVNKVYNLAQKSITKIKKIEEIYKEIQSIYPQNISSLVLYYHFLNDVCVKYKECNKIKEKLMIERQREKEKYLSDNENNQGNRIKFKPNERMCVLHISTASVSIGVILNCNSEVKKYLGYDKNELMNQKVTKIMPKIFSQIHDGFIEQYLKKADSIKLPVQKTVFAFKKNLRVIETCLAVKIFPNILNGFQLVGFFKQRNLKQDIANLIINMKTLEVEGMSEGFVEMTGNRIKLSEIQKQPMRLSHLFPQLDPNHQFRAGQQIQTLFRFSDCTDKLIEIDEVSSENYRKFEKNITIQVQSTNHYTGVDIGVLVVKEFDQLISMQDANKMKKSQGRAKMQKIKLKYQKKSIKSTTEGERYQQISIQRKIEDFISEKSYKNQFFLMKLFYFFCILTLILCMMVMNIYKILNIINPALTQQMGLATNVSIIQGKILTYNEEIVRSVGNDTRWNTYKQGYLAELDQLQNTVVTLFAKANQRKPAKLVINQFIQYPFTSIYKNVSSSSTSYLYFTDGILQIGFLGKNFLNDPQSSFIPPTGQDIEEGRYFIEANVKVMLYQIAQQIVDAYKAYYTAYREEVFMGQLYFVLVRNLIFFLLYIVMYFSMQKFSEFSKLIADMYKNIMKWDAYELYTKCFKFRTTIIQNNTKVDLNPRNEDLLKVFPKSLFVMLSQGAINKGSSPQGQHKASIDAQMGSGSGHKNLVDSNIDQEGIEKENETDILRSPNKIDMIQLSIQTKFNKKFLLILIFLLCIIGANVLFLYLNYEISNQLQVQNRDRINLGNFTNTFLFTYYYGIKSLDNQNQYRSLYDKELDKFYEISKEISGLVISEQSYIRDVYKQIQLLNSIVREQVIGLNDTILQQNIHLIEDTLFKTSDLVSAFSSALSSTRESQMQQKIKIVRSTKIIVDLIQTFIFCKLVLDFLLKPISNQINHSINMIRMVPTWIINKNKNIKSILNMNENDSQIMPAANKNQISQSSSTNLMGKSIVQ